MTTQYTTILKLALPVQGELSGTWGDVVNNNITQMVEEAVAGKAVINSWTTNAHTLTSADGLASESRCAILDLTDTGTALSGAGSVVCPAQTKLYIVENNTAQIVTVKTSSGSGIAVPVNKVMLVYCDGTNVVEGVTHTNSLSLGTSTTTASSILDEDNMASDSATALSTQQSIKAYVDAQVDTVDTLAEILAIGNVTGGTDIAITTTDKVQFRDSAIYINSSTDGQLDIVADTEIQIAATTVDINGAVDVSGEIIAASLDISGNIDVDGVTNLDVVDIDGAVDMASTALVTGVLTTTATQVATGGITSGSNILSDTDSTDSLGSTGVRWLKGWFDTLTAGTLTIGSGSVTDSSGAISFGNENLTTTGIVTAAGTSVFTNLDISGDIDVDGVTNLDVVDIDGAVNMATTALVTGVLTTTATQVATGGITSGSNILSDTDSTDSLGSTGVRWLKGWFDTLTAGTLTIGSGSVTDSSGAISFGNENLTTTGILTGASLDISGDIDVDGVTNLDVVDIDGAVDMASTLTLAGNADFNGDLDVDGTTNLDVVDIDGAVQIDAAVTVGVDDTGYDVKFFGATTGKSLLWDESADSLIVTGTIDATTVEFDSLSGTGAVAVTNILDEDNLSSDSATALSTQQSIKAYVDAQVGTVDTLAEVLANGNTTGGTDIATTTTDKVQFRDSAIYINSSTDGQLDIVADTEIQIAATTVDLNGNLDVSGTALVTGVLTTTATQVATGGITSGSSILSDTDSTDSLGSTAVRWLKGWFDTLTAGTLTIGSGSVTDSSGAISFGDENLTTTGIVTAAGTSVFTNLDISGDVDVDGTTNLDVVDIDGAVDMASTLGVTGVVTANAGVVVDNFTLDGTTLTLSSGVMTLSGADDITLDAAGDIHLDADGADIKLLNGGTHWGSIYTNATPLNLYLQNMVSDGDIYFSGSDSGSAINALILNMSEAGAATFNSSVTATSLDISGDIDVDGTANLDIVDIDGAVDMASTLQVDGAITSSAGATITTADNLPQLTLTSTDADAAVGPVIKLYRNSASPADNDLMGKIQFSGEDDAGNDSTFGTIIVKATDVSNGAEDASMIFSPVLADAFPDALILTGAGATFNSTIGVGVAAHATIPISAYAPDASGNIKLTRAGTAEYLTLGTYYIAATSNDLQLSSSAGEVAIDAATSITLDSDSGVIDFDDAGTNIGRFENSSSDFKIESRVPDKDMLFVGNDNGVGITALTLDMSAAGAATFNSSITFGDGHSIGNDGDDNLLIASSANENIIIDSADDIVLDADGSDITFKDGGTQRFKFKLDSTPQIEATGGTLSLEALTDDADISFKGSDGGSGITALTLDMSEAGNAHFNQHAYFADNGKAIFGGGSDLQIYHDAGDSLIIDSGTGNLLVGSDSFYLRNAANDETMLRADQNSYVKLYYNNAEKLSTVTGGVDVTGAVTATTISAGATTLSGNLQIAENTAYAGQVYVSDRVGHKNDVDTYMDFAVDTISFAAGGEKLVIASSGDVSVSEGDILFSTAGKGIVLGATTNVSANTLDDYEEGSWTPSIGGDASYNVQSGVYTKVGNLVTCWYNQAINTIGTGSTTETSGLPFAVKHIIEQNVNGTQVAYFTSLLLDVVSLSACPERNTSTIRYSTMAAAGDATSVGPAIFKSTTDIYAMVTYQTN